MTSRAAPPELRRTPGTWGRFLAALAALAVVAVGIPVGLIGLSRLALGAWHPVPGFGSWADVSNSLSRELSSGEVASALLRALLAFCWLIWFALLLSVLSSIAASRPSLDRLHLPRLSIFEGVGAWIAAGLIVLSSLTPNTARAATAPRPTSVVQVVDSAAPHRSATRATTPTSVRAGWARVQVGESIEMVADRTLGDGTRWPEIWSINHDRTMDTSGTRWTEPWRLNPNWELELPAPTAPTPQTSPEIPQTITGDVAAHAEPPENVAASATTTPLETDHVAVDDYVVVDGDSYWRIAEHQLRTQLGPDPSGAEVLAYTNELIAANSSRLGSKTNAHMLHPGDIVHLTTPIPATSTPEPPETDDQHLVIGGDSYWRIAHHELRVELGRQPSNPEILAYTNELLSTNSTRLGTPQTPQMLRPGDVVDLHDGPVVSTPPEAAPAPEALPTPPEAVVPTGVPTSASPDPSTTPQPALPASSSADTSTPADTEPVARPVVPSPATVRPADPPVEPGHDAGPEVTPLAGMSSVAFAGLAAAWAFRRSRAARRARPHERPAPPDPAHANAIADIVTRDVSDVTWLAAELRLLAANLPSAVRSSLTVQLVQLDPQRRLEVAFTEIPTAAPPPGWRAAAERVWTLDEAHTPDELAQVADSPPVLPALVTLGDHTDRHLLLNLESTPGINLTGEPDAIQAWLTNVVWELAGGALSEHANALLIDVDIPGADQLPGVSTMSEPSAVELVDAEHPAVSPTSMMNRRVDGTEAWPPTLVLLTANAVTDTWAQLAVRPSVAVIAVGGGLPGGLNIDITDGELSVPAWRLRVSASMLDPSTSAAAMNLLETVDTDPVLDDFTVATPTLCALLEAPSALDDDWDPPSWPVIVHLLGTPHATRDGVRLGLSPQQLSALAFLAVSEDVSVDDFNEAMWSGSEVKSARRRELLADLRKLVGGQAVVSHVEDGRLRAGPDLGTDLGVLEALNARAQKAPAELTQRMHQIMNLVDGQPFAFPSSSAHLWRWVDHPEHLQALWGLRVSTVAWELAGLYLDRHDPAKARDIAEHGLVADPLNEALTERLMEAYGALHAVEAAQRVYESHDRALSARGFDGASKETRRVLERLRAAHAMTDDAAVGS